jgi:hypothetical protein
MPPLSAYRVSLDATTRPNTVAALAAADHLDRARLHYSDVFYSADVFTESFGLCQAAESDRTVDNPALLPDTAYAHSGGRLFIMNSILPLSSQGLAALQEMAGQLELGQRVGRLAANMALELPPLPPTACTAGSSKPARMPMMAMTTNSSTRVKPPRLTARFVVTDIEKTCLKINCSNE